MKRTNGASSIRGKGSSRNRGGRAPETAERVVSLLDEDEQRPLHKNASTTREMRRKFQRSNESSSALAREYGLNPKTVSKHRRRVVDEDLPSGRRFQAFTPSEAELIESFRLLTFFNLRDCVKRLAPVIPQLNLGNLHRLLERVGANRLPWGKTTSIRRGNLESRIGFFHVFVLHRKAIPENALVAFSEETGEVFAFYMKREPTAQKAARFVRMLNARFEVLSHLIVPFNVIFGVPPMLDEIRRRRNSGRRTAGRYDQDRAEADFAWRELAKEEREKYSDHPFIKACEDCEITRKPAEFVNWRLPAVPL